jgi:hypothetical protein
MSIFRQLWNGVWHFEQAADPTVQWAVENFRELFMYVFLVVPALLFFAITIAWCEWEMKRELRNFDRRKSLAEETGEFWVHDLSDEELVMYHEQAAETDF